MPDETEKRQPRFYNHLVRRFSDLWNLPNEAIGYGLGYAGHGIGQITSRLGYGERPRIERDPVRGMTNFINSPLTPMGALTIGHATMYTGDPYDQRAGSPWAGWGARIFDHEAAHAPQARLLGPLYLPSNVVGGLYARARGQEWGGDANWNEVGPYMNPPRPWPDRRR